jgi:hypothetical protein
MALIAFGTGTADLVSMKKNTGYTGFAEIAVSKRKINARFFDQVSAMIVWKSLDAVINRHDTRGRRLDGTRRILVSCFSRCACWVSGTD